MPHRLARFCRRICRDLQVVLVSSKKFKSCGLRRPNKTCEKLHFRTGSVAVAQYSRQGLLKAGLRHEKLSRGSVPRAGHIDGAHAV